ncbi:Saccharopine dehydrogenase-domain-containing protein [Papiliotrema laurentii]|uniref:Saccharopine dehydrogenase-domain-containing protein n=1 Tax=Papiliotrema laurentii TaxID=5418 RepID=A0AAD9CUE3_PAPLA|nr:Saccharopine dehydrogenase-domain-containing protein [Papiliotrema laurentii]
MAGDSKAKVIVYGATSFTARELLTYLDNHPQSHLFDVILSGRNLQRLQASAEKLEKRHKIVACQLDDQEGVKNLISQGDVVINLAGPFQRHNAEALISECAATGKHYVDLTGESQWLATEIIPKYHFQASKTGSCIIPSCGFDSIPSDLSVYLSLKTLQQQHPSATITKSISFFKVKGSISGGTIESMKSVAQIPPKERLRSEWQLVNRFEARPSTPPRFVYELSSPHLPRRLIGGFFFMFPFNRCIVRRSWALSQLHPDVITDRALDIDEESKEPVHGQDFTYEESYETGSKASALLLTGSVILFGILFFGSRVTRWLLLHLLPQAGQGQDMEKLKKGNMAVTNVSQTTLDDVQVITTCKAQGDPGYIVTNYMLAESALSLVLPPPKGTSLPPLAKIGGVLTSASGLGSVLIQRLRDSGTMEWESRIVTGQRAKVD